MAGWLGLKFYPKREADALCDMPILSSICQLRREKRTGWMGTFVLNKAFLKNNKLQYTKNK